MQAVGSLAAGAIGSLVTIVVAFAARLSTVPREVARHDRLVAERDDDLELWVADQHVRLRRELDHERRELAARNALNSGEYAYRLGLVKERSLHSYRDQEQLARRDVAAIYDREGWLHGAWRAIRGRPRHTLDTPAKVTPILDVWRTPPSRPGSAPTSEAPLLNDPTARSVEAILRDLAASTAAFQ